MGVFLCLAAAEKPSLQSRHSLDSSRVQEKDKETGPLWITLALQKQKGFREQQQSRDERRSQREAKLAEKQTRDSVRTRLPPDLLICFHPLISCKLQSPPQLPLMSPPDSKGCGSTSPSSKPQTPDEPKRPDSLLGRFERREQMKKATTLPSSVTGTHPHVRVTELRTFHLIYTLAKIRKTGKQVIKDVKSPINWLHVGSLAGVCGSIILQRFLKAAVVLAQVEILS